MLITVVIPVYNVEDTLERAVRSVTSQEGVDLEIILVDDGSTDRSGYLADQLAEEDSRLRVIHKANGGLSSARNRGIEEAKGEFIAFLDSDDEYCPGIFQSFLEAYQKEKMDYFIFNFDRLTEKGINKKNAVKGKAESPLDALELIFNYNGLDFYAWNKIYRRELFDTVRYPEGKLYEDTMPTYQTIIQAKKVVTTDQVGLNYYENTDSIVAQAFNPKQLDNVTERVRLHEEIKVHYPELTNKSARRLMDGLLSTAYKLSTSKASEETREGDQALKSIALKYQLDLKTSTDIIWQKRLAWWLYQRSPNLYAKLYRLYLGK